jgi:hypothetical protein
MSKEYFKKVCYNLKAEGFCILSTKQEEQEKAINELRVENEQLKSKIKNCVKYLDETTCMYLDGHKTDTALKLLQ